MDYGLLIIFLCAGMWLYGAVLLALSDWRWNLGRVIQCALCGAFAAWLLVTHRTELHSAYVPVVVLLLAATLFLPIFFQRRIHALFIRGNARAARRWGLALSLLLWRPRSATFPAIEPIYAAAARGSAGFLESVPRGHWLERLTAATSRKGFVESQINAWTALGEYRTAIELFEKHFGPGGFRPDADLLYTMVIPYGEAGDLPKAAQCLRRAEEMAAGRTRRTCAGSSPSSTFTRRPAGSTPSNACSTGTAPSPPPCRRPTSASGAAWRCCGTASRKPRSDVIASALARQRDRRGVAPPDRGAVPGARAAPPRRRTAAGPGRRPRRDRVARGARADRPSLGRSSPPSPGSRSLTWGLIAACAVV